MSVSVEEHLAVLLASVKPLRPEPLALEDCLGQMLAGPVRAATPVPGFDNSAMDGYAVRWSDVAGAGDPRPCVLRVVGDIPAGSHWAQRVGAGEAVRIMTGAPVPAGADYVVPQEDVTLDGDSISVVRAPRSRVHIRRRGSDMDVGAFILDGGRPVTSRDLAAAAAAGLDHLTVRPRPRVAIVSTGDELLPPGVPLGVGKIHNSNAQLLAGAVAESGAMVAANATARDDPAAFEDLLARLPEPIDLIVTTGGISVGAFDVVKAAFASLEGMTFPTVRMRPGKSQGFGRTRRGDLLIALPGNPGSAFVSFEAFVRPAIRRMQGHGEIHRPATAAIADESWTTPPGLTHYTMVRVRPGPDGVPRVRPAGHGGSSYRLALLASADGYVVTGEDGGTVAVDDHIQVHLFAS